MNSYSNLNEKVVDIQSNNQNINEIQTYSKEKGRNWWTWDDME